MTEKNAAKMRMQPNAQSPSPKKRRKTRKTPSLMQKRPAYA
jgi:hypothetical protein